MIHADLFFFVEIAGTDHIAELSLAITAPRNRVLIVHTSAAAAYPAFGIRNLSFSHFCQDRRTLIPTMMAKIPRGRLRMPAAIM